MPPEYSIDIGRLMAHYHTPMTRSLTAESMLQGLALSSFGAYACRPGSLLGQGHRLGRRDSANSGTPGGRW
jgi:hypothetical protein